MIRTIPEIVTEEELHKIVRHTRSPKMKAAYIMAFYQALRISELHALKPSKRDYFRTIM